jgi:hypothetical protein
MPHDDEILDLAAIVPKRRKARLTVERPDGTSDVSIYELAEPDDFGPRALQRLFNDYVEMDGLWDTEDRDDAEEKRLAVLLDGLVGRLILDVPADDVALISLVDRRALVVRFFVLIGSRVGETMGPSLVASLTATG